MKDRRAELGNPLTKGDRIFREHLEAHGYTDWTHEQPIQGKLTRPDYRLRHQGSGLFFEVKEFDAPPQVPGHGVFDPHKPIREKLNQPARQVKPYKELSCALVLANPNSAFVLLEDPDVVIGSMLGDLGFRLPIGPDGGGGTHKVNPLLPRLGGSSGTIGRFLTSAATNLRWLRHAAHPCAGPRYAGLN
jgi:hypothetical protein